VNQLFKCSDGPRSAGDRADSCVVLFDEKGVTATQRRFHVVFFQNHWAPTRNAVLPLYSKFEQEGVVKEEQRPRAQTVSFPQNVETILANHVPQPGEIKRILHSDLKLFLYKMSVLRKLFYHDKERLQFAA
jgi:hypothetical protein